MHDASEIKFYKKAFPPTSSIPKKSSPQFNLKETRSTVTTSSMVTDHSLENSVNSTNTKRSIYGYNDLYSMTNSLITSQLDYSAKTLRYISSGLINKMDHVMEYTILVAGNGYNTFKVRLSPISVEDKEPCFALIHSSDTLKRLLRFWSVLRKEEYILQKVEKI